MSAAYYLVRLGYGVTVLEAMPIPGGMMAIGIPEYRLPRETLRAEIDRIVGLGVELRLDAVMGRDFTLSDLEAQGFRAIFLATGAPKSRRLGVPGDNARGVVPATLFLKQVNLGENAAPRGPGRGRRWRQHGDGCRSLRPAQWRRVGDGRCIAADSREMPAQAEEVEAGRARGHHVPYRHGHQRGPRPRRHDVELGRRRTGDRPATSEGGRAVWDAGPRQRDDLAATTVLVAVGEEPDPSILPEGAGIEISAFAGIVADPRTLATGHAGVFAGGDVVSGPKTIIDAVASGRRAAGAIHEYLSGARDGEAEIMATVRYRTPAEDRLVLDPGSATAGPSPCPLPMFEPGSFAGEPGRVRRGHRGQRSEPLLPLRRGPRLRDRRGHRRPWAGRWPDRRPRPPTPVSPPTPPAQAASTRHRARQRRRRTMTPEQVSGLFDCGRGLRRGDDRRRPRRALAAALALHIARPYMAGSTRQVHPAPGRRPVVDHLRRAARHPPPPGLPRAASSSSTRTWSRGKDLPITGGLAAPSAPSRVLLIKLINRVTRELSAGTAGRRILLGLGATLYIGPYFLGVQATMFAGQRTVNTIMPFLVTCNNLDMALPLCYLSAAARRRAGPVAVVYNVRDTTRRLDPRRPEQET